MKGQHGVPLRDAPPWRPAPRPAGADGDGLIHHVDFTVARHSRPPQDHPLRRVAGVACWWLADVLVGGRDIWIGVGRLVLPWPVPRRFLFTVFVPVVFVTFVVMWTHPPWWWMPVARWLDR